MRSPWLPVALIGLLGCGGGDGGHVEEPPDGGGSGGECPERISEGDPCALPADARCFREDTFSSCTSTWCRCEEGRFVCDDGIGAQDGEACAESPLSECAYEGVPNCEIPPTTAYCVCDSDGTWHCVCFCYEPASSCPLVTDPSGCPLRYLPELEGRLCDPALGDCAYPGHICSCVDDGSGQGAFACSPAG